MGQLVAYTNVCIRESYTSHANKFSIAGNVHTHLEDFDTHLYKIAKFMLTERFIVQYISAIHIYMYSIYKMHC